MKIDYQIEANMYTSDAGECSYVNDMNSHSNQIAPIHKMYDTHTYIAHSALAGEFIKHNTHTMAI